VITASDRSRSGGAVLQHRRGGCPILAGGGSGGSGAEVLRFPLAAFRRRDAVPTVVWIIMLAASSVGVVHVHTTDSDSDSCGLRGGRTPKSLAALSGAGCATGRATGRATGCEREWFSAPGPQPVDPGRRGPTMSRACPSPAPLAPPCSLARAWVEAAKHQLPENPSPPYGT
jgi:hypothetical protein